MAKSETMPRSNGLLFECRAPAAKQVFLTGTFNGWDAKAMPMEKTREGTWRVHVELPAGRYEYKFVVDDCWCCEPGGDERASCECVPNDFGTMNRVIEVPQRQS